MLGLGFFLAATLVTAAVGALAAASTPVTPKAKPAEQVPTGDLTHDGTNWGFTPPLVREWCVRAEAVARQPGLSRALAVAWWAIRQRGQAYLGPADAAELAAKDPELCRLCVFPEQEAASTAAIAAKLKAGWPKPADLAGWQSGAFGLGGILGATAVYAGVGENVKSGAGIKRSMLPLVDLPAIETMQRWDVQAWLATLLVWRYMAPQYQALVADPVNAWANIFAAFLDPAAYQLGKGLEAKEVYLKRAQELGIDLAKLPHPGLKQPADFAPVRRAWKWMQAFASRPVIDTSIAQPPKVPQPEPKPAPPVPEPPPKKGTLTISLPNGYTGVSLSPKTPAAGAPLVVLLPGADSDENQLASLVPPDTTARVIAVRGPIKKSKGYSLLDVDLLSPAAAPVIITATAQASEAIRALLAKSPSSRVLVVGYDQGAALALRMANLGLVDGAVAIGGYLPETLLPVRSSGVQQVRIVHGENDGVFALASASKIAQAYSDAGIPVALDMVPGTDHVLSPGLLATAFAAVSAQLAAALPDALGFHWATEDCKLFIDDVPQAQRYVVPRVVAGVTQGAEIGPVVRGVLTGPAPEKCKAAPTDPIDATYALRYYLLARAILQTLTLRGLVPVAQAQAALADTASKLEKFKLKDLPELEV